MPKKKEKTLRDRIIEVLKEGYANPEEVGITADQILELVEKEKLERFNTSDKSLAEQEILEEIREWGIEYKGRNSYEMVSVLEAKIRSWQKKLKQK